MKKLFGGIDLTWKKLIISSILIGVITALIAIIPIFRFTSFEGITTTLEAWILFGIIIIMNSKSSKDSALKCFVFFLISQPLIYLIQVPFSWQGWHLFSYYKFWFMWTILCIPMGYIGYYIKKDKWWGYLILFPMILLTAESLNTYAQYFTFSYPKYSLICLFCASAMIIYPIYLFNNKKIQIFGATLSTILILIITVLNILNPYVYHTCLSYPSDNKSIDNTYKIYLKDNKYGNLEIKYNENVEDYMIYADFKKEGKTKFYIEDNNGNIEEFDIIIKRTTYDIEKVK